MSKLISKTGRPSQLMLEAVERHQADLILVGMSTHSLLNEKLFGSTTSDVAQQTPVPLLILRPQQVSVYTEEEMALRCRHLFRYLLLPYDDSSSAQHVVTFMKAQAVDRPPQFIGVGDALLDSGETWAPRSPWRPTNRKKPRDFTTGARGV